ncbi:putative Pentatricopeptide repeat superfamily protein [Hibiscus syriacus]|uniref:Pentatricopeptide repeat superfamily protein n=1 Tax=Hibiscus syriacus TaxID=106335 RepID=A0A6A3CLJ7_HIBSY|nr:putative Pentatricopeptide repeat superfamily protein [Hibiscus syriacus]
MEEKLCPLLAFFQALGVPEKQPGKMILLNPRLISYSIESKLTEIVYLLATLGLTRDGMIGKILAKYPFIMGYSVDKRLRPISEFLKSIVLSVTDLQTVTMNFPEVLCRDVSKIIKNSLEPRIRFLVDVMGRQTDKLANYPDFFQHGLKKRIELRHRLLEEKGVNCSPSEMLDCNQKKFLLKFGLFKGLS